MTQHQEDIAGMVDDYLHGLLAPEQAARVERNVQSDAAWAAAMAEARRRLEALRALPASEAGEQLINRTLGRIAAAQDRPTRNFRRWRIGGLASALAAAVALLATLHVYFASLEPTPGDLQVLGQDRMLAGTEASLRVRLVNHATGQPIAGAPVEIDLVAPGFRPVAVDSGTGARQGADTGRKPGATGAVRLASFTTDAEGTGCPRFTLPDWADGPYELRVVAVDGRGLDTVTHGVTLHRSWQVMLSTDKPVYQPGQDVLMRSLALRRPDLKPVAGGVAVFTVTDDRGTLVFASRQVSSRFGIAAAQCPLAPEIREGIYGVSCAVGDTRSRTSIEVRKYARPRFKVALAVDKAYYAPGQTIRGTVTAADFLGQAIAGARVEVRLASAGVEETGEMRATLHTDAAGRAAFALPVPAALASISAQTDDASLTIGASVIDAGGQAHWKSVVRAVTGQPLRLELVPEAGVLVPGQTNRVYVFAGYADGRPARVHVKVSGVDREVRTSALGVGAFDATPMGGTMDFTLAATDADGLTACRTVTIPVGGKKGDRTHFDAASKWVLSPFLLRTDRAVYTAGQTMGVMALGTGSGPVYIDLLKDGQTVLTATLAMSAGRGEGRIDLPPDLFGTLELSAYRFDDATQLPVQRSEWLYVRPAQAVHVSITADQPQYLPGAKAKLSFALTDGAGHPLPGALSLAAVDEAVFAALDDADAPWLHGLERAYFTVERPLLGPVFGARPWTPDSLAAPSAENGSAEGSGAATAQRVEFEKAVFARTVRQAPGMAAEFQKALEAGRPGDAGAAAGRLVSESADGAGSLSPHSDDLDTHWLAATSYPAKAARFEVNQLRMLTAARAAWAILGSLVLVGVFLLLVGRVQLSHVAMVAAVAGLFALVGALLVALRPATGWRWVEMPTGATAPVGDTGRATAASEPESSSTSSGPGAVLAESPTAVTPPHVRQWFPETLLWRPELVTNDQGRATLDLTLADSITTWRLAASAVTADGRLGAASAPIRVFQALSVELDPPAAMMPGDEVAVPATVHNHLDNPQHATVALQPGDAFTALDGTTHSLDLQPGATQKVWFRIRALRPGPCDLGIQAAGANVTDQTRRTIDVGGDDAGNKQSLNGTLVPGADVALSLPPATGKGNGRVVVRLYPSVLSEGVAAMEAMARVPRADLAQAACMADAGATVLNYLYRTGWSDPAAAASARRIMRAGYERLLRFEVPRGGFDWFGQAPGAAVPTAMALMTLRDMRFVALRDRTGTGDVDAALVARTQRWLTRQANNDGTWTLPDRLDAGTPAAAPVPAQARLAATAYVAWAAPPGDGALGATPTGDWLTSWDLKTVNDPYILALGAAALGNADHSRALNTEFLGRLVELQHTSADAKLAWWEVVPGIAPPCLARGSAANIEATALAAMALMGSTDEKDVATGKAALAWLRSQRDAHGAWGPPQATLLALEALLDDAMPENAPPVDAGAPPRVVRITLTSGAAGAAARTRQVEVSGDQGGAVQEVEFPNVSLADARRLVITQRSGEPLRYQVVLSQAAGITAPATTAARPGGSPLTIDVAYNRHSLRTGEWAAATATIRNRGVPGVPEVVVELPVAAGFTPEVNDFELLLRTGRIAAYEVLPRCVEVDLREVPGGPAPVVLHYRLKAVLPGKVHLATARVYEANDPTSGAECPGAMLEAR